MSTSCLAKKTAYWLQRQRRGRGLVVVGVESKLQEDVASVAVEEK
jgi:hypothetical protein